MKLNISLFIIIFALIMLSIMSCNRVDIYSLTHPIESSPVPTEDPVIQASINKALTWLKSQQTIGDITNTNYGSWHDSVFLTSFAVLALCNQGETFKDPNNPQNAIDKGIRYIIRNISGIDPHDYLNSVPEVLINEPGFTHTDLSGTFRYAYCTDANPAISRTYSTAMAITALAATKNHAYDSIIKALGTFLVFSQWDENSIVGEIQEFEYLASTRPYGGFGYGIPGSPSDNSNTQFALIGIYIAKKFLKNLDSEDENTQMSRVT